MTESCSFGSFTHDTANHSRTCELCNYVETEAHTFVQEGSTLTCGTCRYSYNVDNANSVAAIGNKGYATLAAAVNAATANDVITLLSDVSLSATVDIKTQITLNGNGKTISAADSFSGKLLEIKSTDGASVANVTLSRSLDSGMQVYKSQNVTLTDVTINDCAKAGLLVNGSTVTAHNLNASGNTWGSVNVDKGVGVTSAASFTLTGDGALEGGESDTTHQIWSELCDWDVVNAPAGYYKYNYVRASDGEEFYVWTTSDPTELSVAKDADDHYYQTLALAVKNAAADSEVVLLGDVSLTAGESVEIPTGQTLTLDLAGHKISGSDNSSAAFAMITNSGDLTIRDSGDEQTGLITYGSTTPDTSYGYANNTILNKGTLTLESGTVKNTTNGGASYTIENSANSGDATFIMTGGTLDSDTGNENDQSLRLFANMATLTSEAVITGGTINNGIFVHQFNANAELTINGTAVVNAMIDCKITNPTAVNIDIDGGEIDGQLRFRTMRAALKNRQSLI